MKFVNNTNVQNLIEESRITNTDAALIQLEKLKDGAIKDYFLNDLANKIAITNSESKKIYDSLLKLVIDDKFRHKITNKFKKLKKLLPGNPSPSFSFENYNGEKTKLDDFAGKYVYIDVWATWCGPCLKEVPYLKELEKKYSYNNITFSSISVDQKRDYDKWKKMISDKKIGGVHLFADESFSSNFFREYQVTAIPRFILIDPQSNIVSADALRPSNPELKVLLNKIL